MSYFENIKNKILDYKIITFVALTALFIIFISELTDAVQKLKTTFYDVKKDSSFAFPKQDDGSNNNIQLPLNIDSISRTIKLTQTTDLNELLKKIALQKKDSICLEWSVLSDLKSIHWLTNGVDYGHEIQFFKLSCPNTRTGILALSNNGNPIYKSLEQRLENGKWELTLCGSNCGVYEIIISNIGFLNSIKEKYLPSVLPKNVNIKDLNYLNDTTMISSLENRYKLTYENNKSLYVKESLTWGSAGYSLTFVINFDEDSLQ